MLSRLIGRRDAGLSAAADRMLEFFRLGHLADEPAGRPELRPAEAARRGDGVHGGTAPRAARRAGGRRQSDDAASLRDRLKAINAEQGATFVVIEHNMEFVMALCNRILVLAEGRIIARASRREVRRDPEGDRGLSWPLTTSCASTTSSPATARRRSCTGSPSVCARGAITTVIGPNGAGKSTAFKAVFGMLPVRVGPHRLRRPRDHQPDAAQLIARRHLLRAAGAQHLSRAVGAAQSRARRRRGAAGASICEPRMRRGDGPVPGSAPQGHASRPRRSPAASRRCSRSPAG